MDDTTPPHVRLRRARVDIGLLVSDVARACGVHVRSVHRWERGVTPPTRASIAVLRRLFPEAGL